MTVMLPPGRGSSRPGNTPVRSLVRRPPYVDPGSRNDATEVTGSRGSSAGTASVVLRAWLAQATIMTGFIALVVGATIRLVAAAMTWAEPA